MLNNTMNTQDAVSANFAECFVTLNGTRYSMLMAKEFEGKAWWNSASTLSRTGCTSWSSKCEVVHLSLDINQLVKAVKQAAVEAVQASGPMSVCFGTVTSASPLKIQVDQKKTLTGAQLMLTNSVRDFTVEMTVDHRTENTSGGSGDASFASHNHAYKGRKSYRVHLALKAGEKVILLRCDGGQKFLVLDRWEAP